MFLCVNIQICTLINLFVTFSVFLTIVLPASNWDKHVFCNLGLTIQSGNDTVSGSQATAILQPESY